MSQNVCPQCGGPITQGESECKFCGEKLVNQQVNQQTVNNAQPQPQTVYVQQPVVQPVVQPVYVSGINPSWPVKSKLAAGILAIFLGGLGIHKFYLGKVGMGLIYLFFSWTFIPAMIGFIEGIIYLCSNDENFQLKHHVRLE